MSYFYDYHELHPAMKWALSLEHVLRVFQNVLHILILQSQLLSDYFQMEYIFSLQSLEHSFWPTLINYTTNFFRGFPHKFGVEPQGVLLKTYPYSIYNMVELVFTKMLSPFVIF